LNEILEEYLKDALWVSLTLVTSFSLFYATNAVRIGFINRVSSSILSLIGKYADLSAEYGGEFTLTIPRTLLLNYSILLNSNEYCILIQGIRVFNGTWKYRFNSMSLEPGGTYSMRALDNGFVLTRR
jgi:hypothetical protein